MEKFNVEKVTAELVDWVREFFEVNGKGCRAVIGISGGKDSTIATAVLVEALGKDRVFGVLMPNGEQKDISDSYRVVEHFGIDHATVNINGAFESIVEEVGESLEKFDVLVSEQTTINLPARLRMSTLYAVSQSMNGRVVNTCNLSEDWVGWATRYGDGAGDFSLFGHLTVGEVKQIGEYLGAPLDLIHKIPADGLTDKSDEDNLGFTYEVLDAYIRDGVEPDPETKKKIDDMHEKNKFKLEYMPIFCYTGFNK